MNPSAEIIRREILAHGPIPFARFMELALYCPQLGYYERKPDNVGQRGDFYTSVSVGGLFGQLLAMQFAEWLGEMRSAECGVRIVEAGAHDGKLAADILNWLQQNRPELFARLEYLIIEPSVVRQVWQREKLVQFGPRVRWLSDFPVPPSALRPPQFPSVIFSNELLDAFPVHRLGWDAAQRTWFEWGVAVAGERFAWTRLSSVASSAILPPSLCFGMAGHPPSSLSEILPDGYTIETCPTAEAWWRRAADSLTAGKLMTIDYGLTAEEMFRPERAAGTLRAYHRHLASADLLANAGEQDLTAHVDFAALQVAGEAAGLRTETFTTQANFLTAIAGCAWKTPAAFGTEWTPALTRQFQTLTHPDFLGRAFRVLVQSC